MCGSIDDYIARKLALGVQCRITSVEYRLAPEQSFPAALEDTISAWKTITSNSNVMKKTSKLFLVGGPAGGHLTLATA